MDIPSDIAADQAIEQQRADAALAKLQHLFAEDPERVADFFATWVVCCDDYEVLDGVGADDRALAPGLDERVVAVETLCELAGTLGFAKVAEHDYDGAEESYTTKGYTLTTDAREGIAKLGARRWLERFLPKETGPQPRTDVLGREEILAALDFSHVVSLDHAIGQLGGLTGTGETPRPLDRMALAEVVIDGLAREVRALRAKLSATVDALNTIDAVTGNVRTLLASDGR